MGHIDVAHLGHILPNGQVLLDDVSFRIGEGTTAALVGPNGAGKTTLIRLIAGDLAPQSGTVTGSGGLGVMRQFVGGIRGVARPGTQGAGGGEEAIPVGQQSAGGALGVASPEPGAGSIQGTVFPEPGAGSIQGAVFPEPGTGGAAGVASAADSAGELSGQLDTGRVTGDSPVRDLLLSVAPPRVQAAAARLDAAELAMMERDDEPTQMRYAAALAEWGDAGGYDAEVTWDACCIAALGVGYERCRWREVGTLSGGEQKRLVLEALLRGPAEVLLLDEPDNYLDVPGKRWLEQQLATTPKTVLLVSHDRELLANCAERIVTVEDGNVWVHGGGFATYGQARRDRIERLDELRRRWDEEHEKLKQLVRMYRQKASYNDAMASRLHAAETRLRKFEEAGPPEQPPRDQNVRIRLRGGRTGKRAVICENLELTGLMRPFDLEVWYGERVAVLGSNGSGKS
ncbi:MAG TPA: ATP-binding cassette domain-containing protein, partial [Streptosporangiaceae bacterium]